MLRMGLDAGSFLSAVDGCQGQAKDGTDATCLARGLPGERVLCSCHGMMIAPL